MKTAEFLYGTAPGRFLLRGLTRPWFSKLGGRLMDSRLSALAVRPFIRAHGIDMTGCEKRRFSSFNDFFTRRLVPGARPVDADPAALVSPCDGRLTVWPVTAAGRFPVKGVDYTLTELVRDETLAARFLGGLVWLFRLSPEHYHRYIWPADGVLSGEPVRIPGLFHTVQPVEKGQQPVYRENTREYRLVECPFGPLVMMEVGALLVGRIVNAPAPAGGAVRRGREKGYFAFGGSTVILLTAKGAAAPDEPFAAASAAGRETDVLQGQRVGTISAE